MAAEEKSNNFLIIIGVGILIGAAIVFSELRKQQLIQAQSQAAYATEIGNHSYNWWIPAIQNAQNIPEMKWDWITRWGDYVLTHNPEHRVYQQGLPSGPNGEYVGQKSFYLTDLNFVKGRFDLALTQSILPWEYGCFLLYEEVLTPVRRCSWSWSNINTWNIDDLTYNIMGIEIESLKHWYIRKYGSWNTTWWTSVSTPTTSMPYGIYTDPVLNAWSNEYSLKLYTAWHLFMHSIGKKSAIGGPIGIRTLDMVAAMYNSYYPNGIADYIFNNYDLFLQYQYPNKKGGATWDYVDTVNKNLTGLRSKIKGKMAWLLTKEWGDGVGVPFNESVAKEEFNLAYNAGVDVILCQGNIYQNYTGLYPPMLLSWYNERNNCLQPQCNFSIQQI